MYLLLQSPCPVLKLHAAADPRARERILPFSFFSLFFSPVREKQSPIVPYSSFAHFVSMFLFPLFDCLFGKNASVMSLYPLSRAVVLVEYGTVVCKPRRQPVPL